MNERRSVTSASTLPPPLARVAVILFGLECLTTRLVLERLRAAGVSIRVVCLPGPPGTAIVRAPIPRGRLGPPLATPSGAGSVTAAAAAGGIEVWRVGDLRAPETAKAIAALEADLLIVACFDRLIPPALYESQRLGGINIHPSLLPDKRGPDPLFWTFKCGDHETGSTVHRLTSRFDAGDILAQSRIDVPDGISETDLDEWLATLGADQAVDAIAGLLDGSVSGRVQDEARVTWASHPTAVDYRLDQSGTARTAFNFVRGVGGRGQPFLALADGREVALLDALAWAGSPDALPSPSGDQIVIPFADGALLAAIASTAT